MKKKKSEKPNAIVLDFTQADPRKIKHQDLQRYSIDNNNQPESK